VVNSQSVEDEKKNGLKGKKGGVHEERTNARCERCLFQLSRYLKAAVQAQERESAQGKERINGNETPGAHLDKEYGREGVPRPRRSSMWITG